MFVTNCQSIDTLFYTKLNYFTIEILIRYKTDLKNAVAMPPHQAY